MKSWKLEAVGLSLNVEPYSASDRFHSDTTLWPKIEFQAWHLRSGTTSLMEADGSTQLDSKTCVTSPLTED